MGRPHLSSTYLSQPPSFSQHSTVPLYVDAPFDLDNVQPEDVVYEAFLDSEHTLQNIPSTPALHPDVTGPSTSQNAVLDAARDASAISTGSRINIGDVVRSGEAQARTSTPSPGLAAATDLLSMRGFDPSSLPYLSQLVDRLQDAITRARPDMDRAARTEDPLEHRLPRVEAIFRPYLDEALLPFREVPEIDYVGRLFERRIVLNTFGHDSSFMGVGETAIPSSTTTSTPEPSETTVPVAVEAPVKLEEGSSEDDLGMSTEYDTDLNSDTDFSDCASDPGFDEEDIYMQDADIRSLSPSVTSVSSEERCGTPFLPAPPNKHEVDLTRWWTPSRPTSVTGWSRASSLSRCQSPLPRSSVRSPMSDSTCSEEDDLQSPTSSYCIGSGQLHPFFRPASPHVSAASINAKRAGNSLHAHPAIASPLAFKLPSAYPDIKIVDYANV